MWCFWFSGVRSAIVLVLGGFWDFVGDFKIATYLLVVGMVVAVVVDLVVAVVIFLCGSAVVDLMVALLDLAVVVGVLAMTMVFI